MDFWINQKSFLNSIDRLSICLKGDIWVRGYPSEASCRAVPYGIYDVTKNTGYVFVGTSNNTPEFAVDAISRWWKLKGSLEYQNKNQICILADGGGSNGWRSRAWKKN